LNSIDLERPLQPWIYRIAHNEAANYLRTVSGRKESRLDDDQWNNITDEKTPDRLSEKEDRQWIRQALRKLKPKYREVIVLYYFEEKSYEEIAQALNTSTNSVGTLLRRGRLQLQKMLKNAGLMVSIFFGNLLLPYFITRGDLNDDAGRHN